MRYAYLVPDRNTFVKHIRFWTAVLQGLGYAFLLMGTIVSLRLMFIDGAEFETDSVLSRVVGVATLLGTWTFSALMIVIASYVDLRVDKLETDLPEEIQS